MIYNMEIWTHFNSGVLRVPFSRWIPSSISVCSGENGRGSTLWLPLYFAHIYCNYIFLKFPLVALLLNNFFFMALLLKNCLCWLKTKCCLHQKSREEAKWSLSRESLVKQEKLMSSLKMEGFRIGSLEDSLGGTQITTQVQSSKFIRP